MRVFGGFLSVEVWVVGSVVRLWDVDGVFRLYSGGGLVVNEFAAY